MSSESAPDSQAAREDDEHQLLASAENSGAAVPCADAQVASEAMSPTATLSRLADTEPTHVPPARQLSGEPPAV